MISAVAREGRSARSKAREVSRKLARIHRGAREELSKAEDVTLWILGGVAVLGGGYLAYQALSKPAAAAVPPAGTTPPTPSTPTTTPTPPSASTVSWPAGSYPWAPPSNPATLPAGFGPADSLMAQDPMWIAMAQSALGILSLGSGATVSYSGTPNGVADTNFMIAVTQVQAFINTSIAQLQATTPQVGFVTHPHSNGLLDLKTMGFLILMSALSAAASGTTLSPTAVSDPILQREATNAIGQMVASGAAVFASYVPGIVAPITSAQVQNFQSNWTAATPQLALPITGNIDWLTWGAAVGVAG